MHKKQSHSNKYGHIVINNRCCKAECKECSCDSFNEFWDKFATAFRDGECVETEFDLAFRTENGIKYLVQKADNSSEDPKFFEITCENGEITFDEGSTENPEDACQNGEE